jgi:hypothetical protein
MSARYRARRFNDEAVEWLKAVAAAICLVVFFHFVFVGVPAIFPHGWKP